MASLGSGHVRTHGLEARGQEVGQALEGHAGSSQAAGTYQVTEGIAGHHQNSAALCGRLADGLYEPLGEL